MNRMLAILASMTVAACAGEAAAPTLTVTRSVDIDAAPAAVWDLVKDFDALNRWHPAVAGDEIVEGANNTVGAVRLLTLGDGGTIRETLLAYDAVGHSFTYNILEGVLPVSSYESTVKVEAVGDAASKVTWSGTFKRKDTSADPAPGADDAAATSTIESVYQAGLENLERIAESQ